MSEGTEVFGAPARTLQNITEEAVPQRQGTSLLAELTAEANKTIERKVRYKVPGRDGWEVEFSTSIDGDDFKRYRRVAQGKKKRTDDADPVLMSGMALVEHNTGIFVRGQLVTDDEGDPVLFNSEEFLAMHKVNTAVAAISKFLGDGTIISMGGSLYTEAGFGEDLQPEDPTDA